MEKQVSKPAWLVALKLIVPIVIIIVLMPFITVAIVGFQWGLLLNVFKVLWLAFLVIIGFVYVLLFLLTKYPFGTVSIGLLCLASILMFASPQGNTFAQQLRSTIQGFVDINYLVASFTIMAFLLAFFSIYKEKRGR